MCNATAFLDVLYLVFLDSLEEGVPNLSLDVPLVAPDSAHNGDDEDDEHEDKVGPQHALATLHHELTL